MKTITIIFLLTLSTSFVFSQLTDNDITYFVSGYMLNEMDGYLLHSNTSADNKHSYIIGISDNTTFDDIRYTVRRLLETTPQFKTYIQWRFSAIDDGFFWTALIYNDINIVLLSYWPNTHTIFITPKD